LASSLVFAGVSAISFSGRSKLYIDNLYFIG
jgi:hypothetical protein